ncbi:D-glycero-beta-D-manno-heptose-7-phosphate kinase [Desulfatiglans anilini]|uniref:D-glycero-beta-D-manno-heptose-7-phosphate kinase n=1 Tax=Desulfatiglans anilini TaxID=90728 RepID=UPI00042883CA|nr:D-glycero-beta-D-manno-heptose-7-phosphate kinase [Desulfatiglans anilini]
MLKNILKTLSGRHFEKMLQDAVDRFKDARVLVVGDIIMDQYIWGQVTRISPEAPVPVVEVREETRMLGGAANVVHNMSTLGATAVLCGVVGEDHAGREVLEKLRALEVPTDGVIVEAGRPTSLKTRIVAHSQQVVRFDRESKGAITDQSAKTILDYIETSLDSLDAIVVSDYGKGVVSAGLMTGLRELVDSGRTNGVRIAVDPKTGNFEYYQGVDVITPNHHEAGAYCGFAVTDDETLLAAGRRMLQELQCRSVLITQGKDGMTLFEQEGRVSHIGTVAKQVFDVTGAGDTVISTLALAMAAGLDLREGAMLANYAAGIVVGEVGTSTVRAEDLKRAVADMKSLRSEAG